ncbi:MAG TPA: type II toxin-antitoxin system VapC family toxin [Gemmataceae bacterium]|jgi:predicted nucleic acid-binding protein
MAVRLLDTNIVSFSLRRHPLAAKYRPHLAGHSLAISFMTVAELYEGAALASWGRGRIARMEATLRGYVIVESDPDVCRWWAAVRAQRHRQPIATADAWIAASALAYGLELVTHNPADFAGIPGLTVVTEAP